MEKYFSIKSLWKCFPRGRRDFSRSLRLRPINVRNVDGNKIREKVWLLLKKFSGKFAEINNAWMQLNGSTDEELCHCYELNADNEKWKSVAWSQGVINTKWHLLLFTQTDMAYTASYYDTNRICEGLNSWMKLTEKIISMNIYERETRIEDQLRDFAQFMFDQDFAMIKFSLSCELNEFFNANIVCDENAISGKRDENFFQHRNSICVKCWRFTTRNGNWNSLAVD